VSRSALQAAHDHFQGQCMVPDHDDVDPTQHGCAHIGNATRDHFVGASSMTTTEGDGDLDAQLAKHGRAHHISADHFSTHLGSMEIDVPQEELLHHHRKYFDTNAKQHIFGSQVVKDEVPLGAVVEPEPEPTPAPIEENVMEVHEKAPVKATDHVLEHGSKVHSASIEGDHFHGVSMVPDNVEEAHGLKHFTHEDHFKGMQTTEGGSHQESIKHAKHLASIGPADHFGHSASMQSTGTEAVHGMKHVRCAQPEHFTGSSMTSFGASGTHTDDVKHGRKHVNSKMQGGSGACPSSGHITSFYSSSGISLG